MSEQLLRRRWLIGVLLFLATVLNYVDRQVFSILAPDLQRDIGWSELDYSRIVNAFQLAYAVAMLVVGGVLDRVGAKLGLAWSMVLWCAAAAGHDFHNLGGFEVSPDHRYLALLVDTNGYEDFALQVIDLESGAATGADQGCARSFPVKIENGRVFIDMGKAAAA